MGFSITNHPFGGAPISGNLQLTMVINFFMKPSGPWFQAFLTPVLSSIPRVATSVPLAGGAQIDSPAGRARRWAPVEATKSGEISNEKHHFMGFEWEDSYFNGISPWLMAFLAHLFKWISHEKVGSVTNECWLMVGWSFFLLGLIQHFWTGNIIIHELGMKFLISE